VVAAVVVVLAVPVVVVVLAVPVAAPDSQQQPS